MVAKQAVRIRSVHLTETGYLSGRGSVNSKNELISVMLGMQGGESILQLNKRDAWRKAVDALKSRGVLGTRAAPEAEPGAGHEPEPEPLD